MNPSLLYRFLKIYCTAGLWFYFRQWHVVGREKVPTKGPLLYIANHQNAFLDAILMTCSASRNPFALARANVFKKPWAAKLLSLLHLKPIYRFRDGFGTLKNNDVILQDCINLMKQGEVILLFPEGNHNEPWSMREFQKGFARMAMMYHQQTNGEPLHIIPIGIHYTEHFSFNARVLIEFGDPLSVGALIKEQRSDRDNLDAIVRDGEHAVKKLALDLKPESEYEVRRSHLEKNRSCEADMTKQLAADRKTAAAYPKINSSPYEKSILIKLLRLPLAVYVYLTHGLHYWWIKTFIRKNIKDPQFISSVKYAIGIFTTPLYYLFLVVVVYGITRNAQLSLWFLASLPIALIIFIKTNKS